MHSCLAEQAHQVQCPVGWELPRTHRSVPGLQVPCCVLQPLQSLRPHSNGLLHRHLPVHVPAVHTGKVWHLPI